MDTALLGRSMWCRGCKISLSFSNVEKETQRGLTSIFNIRSSKCSSIIEVASSETMQTGSGYTLFAVNCEAAAGCINSGIGHEQLKVMLSAMNLPIIHHNTINRAEAQIGPAFKESAKASCIKAIAEGRNLTLAAQRDVIIDCEMEPAYANSDAKVGIISEYDFGWDKRGSGFSHSTVKVAVSSACCMCDHGHVQEDHDCRKNHQGSAKSMEPASTVNLLVNSTIFKEGKVRVDVLVGDEDASTICHVQQAANHNVEKWIDTNHTVKKFSNKLVHSCKEA
ncbi:hypothetical protein PV325_000805 [Microctonus aethiopoides]|uniref:Mutator-like transposase domain-containing protein n=1 Tax=Microctonus aethiopoides TaxID=144406 RepID=A0AA39C9Y0_9HYME|nr:hypothetical protein PV325_000805 [Microctonus aethiopoides]KAK0092742.1 hypothetical protein PV326_000695 [Microctonus aethiopoides]KAK0160294.1 hypothetical protein PV328_007722 [Microctonus aethiopoides]